MEEKIIICPINPTYAPEYKTAGAAGGDLRAREYVTIPPHGVVKIPSGLKIAMPKGFVFVVKPRSSLAVKKNLLVIEGTIDSDYRGEISIVVYNLGDTEVEVFKGERIAQGVIIKQPLLGFGYSMNYDRFEEEYPTDRGTGGFGSTGII